MPTPTATAKIHERIASYGADMLNNDELLQVVLNITPDRSSDMIRESGGIHVLAQYTAEELATAYGLTPRQGRILNSAIVLGKRINQGCPEARPQVSCPADAVNYLAPLMANALQEQLHLLLLTTRNHIFDHRVIYIGAVNTSPFRPAEVLRPAIVRNAPNIIIAHNHPSGDITPSPEDVSVTRDIRQAGMLMDIQLLDHLVIGDGHRFTSLKNKKMGFD